MLNLSRRELEEVILAIEWCLSDWHCEHDPLPSIVNFTLPALKKLEDELERLKAIEESP